MVDLRSPVVRRVAVVAFAAYLLVLAGVAFLPLPGAPFPGSQGDVPVELSLRRPDLLTGWETQRNVLMTVPFGVLLPLVVRWRYEALLLACVAVTLVIETGQLLGSLAVGWAWRAFDVNDLLNNTIGALLGLGVTAAALAWQHRSTGRSLPLQRLPVRRLLPGVLAVVLVVWAAGSTLTTPPYVPPVDACAQPPTGATTQLLDGTSAYAAADGSLCLLGPGGGSGSVPADTAPGVVSEVQEEGGGGWQVGVALPGGPPVTDAQGAVVPVQPVQGSDLLVWARPLP